MGRDVRAEALCIGAAVSVLFLDAASGARAK